MDDAFPVCFVERIGDFDGGAERLIERQCALGESLGERFALQALHDQEVDSVLATDVVHRADVRMTQGRQRLGFALEPLSQF